MRNEKELRLTKAERRRFAAEINGGDGRCLFFVCVLRKEKQWVYYLNTRAATFITWEDPLMRRHFGFS